MADPLQEIPSVQFDAQPGHLSAPDGQMSSFPRERRGDSLATGQVAGNPSAHLGPNRSGVGQGRFLERLTEGTDKGWRTARGKGCWSAKVSWPAAPTSSSA